MKAAIFCVLALVLAPIAWAQQPMFKSTMPDGKVIYADKPQPGATRIDKIEPPPSKTGMGGLTQEEKARAAKLTQERQQAETAAAKSQQSADDARKALQAAEAAREKGREPLPGERLGLAGGGTRLTDDYHNRQKSLDAAVEAARKKLQAAEGR